MKWCFEFFFVAGVGLLLAAGSAQANLLTNGDFGTGDLTGWSIASANAAQTTISYDGSEGQPAGSALLDRVDVTLDDNKDILYQIIPVTNGEQYQFNADWTGDLYNGGDGRNWAEAMVTFLSSNAAIPDGLDPAFADANIKYKKASSGGPNDPPANGWDWESVLLSPDSGPADGIFIATDDYMLVGFNLGGRDAADSRHTLLGRGYYNLDNVSVDRVIPEPASAILLLFGSISIVARRRH